MRRFGRNSSYSDHDKNLQGPAGFLIALVGGALLFGLLALLL